MTGPDYTDVLDTAELLRSREAIRSNAEATRILDNAIAGGGASTGLEWLGILGQAFRELQTRFRNLLTDADIDLIAKAHDRINQAYSNPFPLDNPKVRKVR